MKRLWVDAEIDAPGDVVWELLTTTDHWPQWGPTVSGATVDGGRMELGARGQVTTVLGLRLPFEITEYVEGERWAWRVAGVPATDHTVNRLGPDRCVVGFGVPWPAAPYLAVCQVALRRLSLAAKRERITS